MKKLFTLLTVVVMTVLLVACVNENPSKPEENEGETVSITHSVGTIDTGKTNDYGKIYNKALVTEAFKKNPKRVATFSLGVLDMLDTVGLDTLGITHLAVPRGNLSSTGLEKYGQDPYFNAGTLFAPDEKALELLQPDLIILDGRTSSRYVELKAKFPTANVLDASMTTYSLKTQFDVATNLSKIFSSSKAAIDKEMDEIVKAVFSLRRLTNTTKAMFVMTSGSSVSIYGGGTLAY